MADFRRRHVALAKSLSRSLDEVSHLKEDLVNEREGILSTFQDHQRIGNGGEIHISYQIY